MMAGEEDWRGGGRAETRRILKTFAVLLIFFSKWVKLFYDFQQQFLPTDGSLSLSLSLPLSLSLFPLSPSVSPAFPSFFHRIRRAWQRHVHSARLVLPHHGFAFLFFLLCCSLILQIPRNLFLSRLPSESPNPRGPSG
jgi:hypothetical protein